MKARQKPKTEDPLGELLKVGTARDSSPRQRNEALEAVARRDDPYAAGALVQAWESSGGLYWEPGMYGACLPGQEEFHKELSRAVLHAVVRGGHAWILRLLLQTDWNCIIEKMELLALQPARLFADSGTEIEAIRKGRSMGRGADIVADLLRGSPEAFSSEALDMLCALEPPLKEYRRPGGFALFKDPDQADAEEIHRYTVDIEPLRALAGSVRDRRRKEGTGPSHCASCGTPLLTSGKYCVWCAPDGRH